MASSKTYLIELSLLFVLGTAAVITLFEVYRSLEQNTGTYADTEVNIDTFVRLDYKFRWNSIEVPRRFVFSQYAEYNVPEHPRLEVDCGTIVGVSCELCRVFFFGLKELVARGTTQDEILDFAVNVCVRFKIEDPRVCKAICREFAVSISTFNCICCGLTFFSAI